MVIKTLVYPEALRKTQRSAHYWALAYFNKLMIFGILNI
jgi:hypothetical protein